MKIGKATLNDITEINKICIEGVTDEKKLQFPKLSREKIQKELKKLEKNRIKCWKKDMKSQKSYWIVSENNKEIIAYGNAWVKRKNLGVIESIYVGRKYRNKGVGKKLMSDLVKWLRKKKIPKIESRIYLKNKPSIKFHKKLGFKPLFYIMEK